jgi:hypothetical protein
MKDKTTATIKDKKIEQHPFEFVLRINGHFICQRYFNIHNFNPDVIDSLELREVLNTIAGMNNGEWGQCGIIPQYLKDRSNEYLEFFESNPQLSNKGKEDEVKDVWEKDDIYTFEIRIDGEVIGITQFAGNHFPPKIRYKVNLKHETNIWGEKVLDEKGQPIPLEILPIITKEIKKVFSQRSYTKDYMGYSLDYVTKMQKEYDEKYQTLVD